MYRDDVSRAELEQEILTLEDKIQKLEDRLYWAGCKLPNADTLSTWVAPYINWWGLERGSRCPGCDAQDFQFPRVKVHVCDFIKGDHVHVTCKNCHETSCWREKR